MPSRRLPNSVPTTLHGLKTPRDFYLLTPNAADRAIDLATFAKLDPADPTSFLNRWLKELGDIGLAKAAGTPITGRLQPKKDRAALLVSHFHQVLDMGITRDTFADGARSYYGRDIGSTTIPDLSNQPAVMEAAEKVVTGEAARATAEGAAYVAMGLPSAAEVAALRTQFLSLFNLRDQALVKTNREREELMALYIEAQILAVDICDTVEFFFRKDTDDGSRRQKCERWGVVYHFEAGELPGQAIITAATSPGPSQAHLEFDAPRATRFDVLHKAPGAPAFVKVADDIIEKSFNATGLVAGAHEFKIIPRNSRGDGPESGVSGVNVG